MWKKHVVVGRAYRAYREARCSTQLATTCSKHQWPRIVLDSYYLELCQLPEEPYQPLNNNFLRREFGQDCFKSLFSKLSNGNDFMMYHLGMWYAAIRV